MTALLRFDPSAPDVAGFYENQMNICQCGFGFGKNVKKFEKKLFKFF